MTTTPSEWSPGEPLPGYYRPAITRRIFDLFNDHKEECRFCSGSWPSSSKATARWIPGHGWGHPDLVIGLVPKRVREEHVRDALAKG